LQPPHHAGDHLFNLIACSAKTVLRELASHQAPIDGLLQGFRLEPRLFALCPSPAGRSALDQLLNLGNVNRLIAHGGSHRARVG
jgi:hypothetical protein